MIYSSDTTQARAILIEAAKDFLTGSATINTAEGVIENLPVIPVGEIAWENKNFDTQGKEIWTSVFYRPNQPVSRTIGPGGMDEITGFLQIDFNVKSDSGENELIAWERKTRVYFHGGRYFRKNGNSVIATSSGMSQGRQVENYYRKSLTVAFKAHVKRPQLTN